MVIDGWVCRYDVYSCSAPLRRISRTGLPSRRKGETSEGEKENTGDVRTLAGWWVYVYCTLYGYGVRCTVHSVRRTVYSVQRVRAREYLSIYLGNLHSESLARLIWLIWLRPHARVHAYPD